MRLYRRALPMCVTVGLGSGPNTSALLHSVNVPYVTETGVARLKGVGPTRFPKIPLAMNRSGWLEATLELARLARENRSGPDRRLQ
jgi:hypothetical protein